MHGGDNTNIALEMQAVTALCMNTDTHLLQMAIPSRPRTTLDIHSDDGGKYA